MTYPVISAPYGLKPLNLLGGQVFAGSTRMLPITSGYSTGEGGIFYGDLVQLSGGSLILSTLVAQTSTGGGGGSSDPGQIGIFLGCQYTNASTKQKLYSQFFPDGTTSPVNDIVAFVTDDPDTVFKAVVTNVGSAGSTVVTGIPNTYVGANVGLVYNAGSTITGDSAWALDGNTVATTSLPMRIVGVVPDTATYSNGAPGFPGNLVYPEVLVKYNFGYHSYYNSLGA
jgi:putative transposon-encoded protein